MYDNHSNAGKMRKGIWFLLAPVIFAAIVYVIGTVVQWLWNAILPGLTGVGVISFWQAVGLFVLCRILFGGFRGGRGGHWGGREKWGGPSREARSRWMQMSEEERLQFKEAWRDRCKKKD